MSPGEQSTQVEWKQLQLPSDRLELGPIRLGLGGDPRDLSVILHNIRLLETEFVRDTFLADRYEDDPTAKHVAAVVRDEKAKQLATLYLDAGLAGGKHEARQLVTTLKRSVIALRGNRSPD